MTSTTFARINLLLSALIFAGFGFWFLVHPGILEITGVGVSTPSARVEIRGFYGGLELGIACFLVMAWRRSWLVPGLAIQTMTLGGIAAGRLVGMVLEAEQPANLMLVLMAAEVGGAALGAVALWRLNHTKRTGLATAAETQGDKEQG